MTDLFSVYDKLSPEPLQEKDLDCYVDTYQGRGGVRPVSTLKRLLGYNREGILPDGKLPDRELQILFSGYKGCGKSTELNKLQYEIEHDFIVVNFSVRHELDIINLTYIDLFVITMEKLFYAVADHGIEIDTRLFTSIREWSRTEELQTISDLTGEALVETGGEASLGIRGFARFFGKMRLAGRASSTTRKTIIDNIEPRVSDFIGHCNDLIREIRRNLEQCRKKGLLIIMEDLDKLSVEKAEELFFNHSHILNSLQTNVIFTIPISLCYHPNAVNIKGNFSEHFELPMVKVHDKEGALYPDGRETLYRLITRRIPAECFDSPDLIYRFLDISGGCLRDLFSMLRSAVNNALDNERAQITDSDYRTAFFLLRREYENTIAEKRVDNRVLVSVGDYYDALVGVALSKTKKVNNTATVLDLRQNLCILGYNDEGWCDVHPLVRTILQERELIP